MPNNEDIELDADSPEEEKDGEDAEEKKDELEGFDIRDNDE